MEHPETVKKFVFALQNKDFVKLIEYFSNECQVNLPPLIVNGRTKVSSLFKAVHRKYKNINWEITKIYQVDSKTIIFQSKSWGTKKSDEFYNNEILTIVEFNEEGKISFLSDYFKDTSSF